MLQMYADLALEYAFPVLAASVAVYFAAGAVSERLSRRRLEQRQAAESSHRRQVYTERFANGESRPANESAEKDASPADDVRGSPVVRPRAPASTSRPFGSDYMTMSDLRSRVSGPSSSCMAGSCCG